MAKNKTQTPIKKFPNLQKRFRDFEKLRQTHLNIGIKMLSVNGGNIYLTDLVIIGILKRSLDILDGVISLVKYWNFIAAAPLLRLQLDSLLKLSYLAKSKNADIVSMKIIKGYPFQNLKDEEGKKLTDARLRDYACSVCPGIDNMYREISKLIHLSNKHCFLTVHSLNKQSLDTRCPNKIKEI